MVRMIFIVFYCFLLFIFIIFTFILILDIQGEMSRNGPGLYEFLMEAELQQYYPGIRGIICFHLFYIINYISLISLKRNMYA